MSPAARYSRLRIASIVCAAVCVLLWPEAYAQVYNFTTIAGSAGQFGAADGTNGSARFNSPTGLALDRFGNIFVSDANNSTIRKVSLVGTDWVVTTIAGLAGSPGSNDGTNSDARFNKPNGLTMDADGTLYLADRYNHILRRIAAQGTDWIVTTIAGSPGIYGATDGTNNAAQFHLPSGLAHDNAGNLYVADTINYTIRQAAPVGTDWVVSTIAGFADIYGGFTDGANTNAAFNTPYGLTVDSRGILFVADWGNSAVRQIKHAGTDWLVTTLGGFTGIGGTNDGPGSVASFWNPAGIAADAAGNLYVTDQSNNTIRKMTPGGSDWTVTTIGGMPLKSGTADGVGDQARFKKPWGIAVDPAGVLYIADFSNHTIRMGVPVRPEPELQIAVNSGQVLVAWPLSASNYVLEVAASVSPGASWNLVSEGIFQTASSYAFTNSISGPTAFYRLRGP